MEVTIRNSDDDCNILRTITGIAHNAPVPDFKIGAKFKVAVKKSQEILTVGGNFCLTFSNAKAENTFPNGIEVNILSIPSDQIDEHMYYVEVLSHNCTCD